MYALLQAFSLRSDASGNFDSEDTFGVPHTEIISHKSEVETRIFDFTNQASITVHSTLITDVYTGPRLSRSCEDQEVDFRQFSGTCSVRVDVCCDVMGAFVAKPGFLWRCAECNVRVSFLSVSVLLMEDQHDQA